MFLPAVPKVPRAGNAKAADEFNNVYKEGDKLPIIVSGAGKVRRGSFVVSDGQFGFAVRSDGGLDFLSYHPSDDRKQHNNSCRKTGRL